MPEAHMPRETGRGDAIRRARLTRSLRWIPNQRLRDAAVEHPWMTLAGVFSLCIPLVVAFIPAGGSAGPNDRAGVDEQPIPGRVEVHADDLGTQAFHGDPGLIAPPSTAAAPQALEPGWNLPQNPPGAYAVRHAALGDERTGGIERVGSNQPATAPARGAWLTGTIEDAPPNRRKLR